MGGWAIGGGPVKPDFAHAYYEMGATYEGQGLREEVIAQYQAAGCAADIQSDDL